MSRFYQYEFISPEPLYAKVKEELKSYFDTGAVDDLMFPIWTNHCLRKLGRGTLPIVETVLFLDDYAAILPRGFKYVREAWLCTESAPISIRKPGAYYSQTISLLNPSADPCEPTCGPCRPLITELIYKSTTDELFTTRTSHLLRPGNTSAKNVCGEHCPNLHSESEDVFEVKDGKFHTNFRTGDVYLKYYALEYDDLKNQTIPDNQQIQDYIEAYLKCKIFEQLWNQVTDETFNQIERKYQVYEQKKNEAYIVADIEVKKETMDDIVRATKRMRNRFNKYRIR